MSSSENIKLYLYKLNEETGEITQTLLENVSYTKSAYSEWYSYKDIHGNVHFSYPKDLNKFKANQLYSFDGDINNIKKIVLDAIRAKYKKAFEEEYRWRKVLNIMGCLVEVPEVYTKDIESLKVLRTQMETYMNNKWNSLSDADKMVSPTLDDWKYHMSEACFDYINKMLGGGDSNS